MQLLQCVSYSGVLFVLVLNISIHKKNMEISQLPETDESTPLWLGLSQHETSSQPHCPQAV